MHFWALLKFSFNTSFSAKVSASCKHKRHTKKKKGEEEEDLHRKMGPTRGKKKKRRCRKWAFLGRGVDFWGGSCIFFFHFPLLRGSFDREIRA